MVVAAGFPLPDLQNLLANVGNAATQHTLTLLFTRQKSSEKRTLVVLFVRHLGMMRWSMSVKKNDSGVYVRRVAVWRIAKYGG